MLSDKTILRGYTETIILRREERRGVHVMLYIWFGDADGAAGAITVRTGKKRRNMSANKLGDRARLLNRPARQCRVRRAAHTALKVTIRRWQGYPCSTRSSKICTQKCRRGRGIFACSAQRRGRRGWRRIDHKSQFRGIRATHIHT